MSEGQDQLEHLVRARRHCQVVGAAVALICSAWAVWPRSTVAIGTPQLRTSATGPTLARTTSIDLAAFNAPIWNPTPPPKPIPPPPPMRLQLVAIAAETLPNGHSQFRAAVYDPDTDTLLQVVNGDQIAGRGVIRVTANEVEISEGQATRRLVLDTATSVGAGAKP